MRYWYYDGLRLVFGEVIVPCRAALYKTHQSLVSVYLRHKLCELQFGVKAVSI